MRNKNTYIVISISVVLVILIAILINKYILNLDNQKTTEIIDTNSLLISKYTNVNADNSIQMKLISEEPLNSNDIIEYSCTNNTKEQMYYGLMYDIEVFNNNNWYTLQSKEQIIWAAYAQLIEAGDTHTGKIALSEYELYPSHLYRVIKTFGKDMHFSVEFTLK